jgi:hypothetical protein
MGDSDNLRTNDVASFGLFRPFMAKRHFSVLRLVVPLKSFISSDDGFADICLGDSGIVSGDTCPPPEIGQKRPGFSLVKRAASIMISFVQAR